MQTLKSKSNTQVLGAIVPFVMVGSLFSIDVQAEQYRVQSSTYAGYQNDGTVSSPFFGQETYYDYDSDGNYVQMTRNRSTYFNNSLDSEYQSTQGNSANAIPGAAQFNRTLVGDASLGIGDVQASGYAYTTWGSNHASASGSGFTPVDRNVTAYPQIPDGNGGFIPDLNFPIDIQSSTSLYSSAHSQWEELYQISGHSGTGTAQVTMHIDGLLSGVQAVGDNAYMNYSLRSFNGDTILSMSASIYTYLDFQGNVQQYWSQSIWNTGVWDYDSGTGDLVVDEMLHGSYAFTYGNPLYLNSILSVSTNGNASSDFGHTVTMESLVLPENSLVYALSGTDMSVYGASFDGSGGGTLCTSLDCVNGGFGGGNGGGGSTVPVPAAAWLFASGLLGLGGFASRRKRATV